MEKLLGSYYFGTEPHYIREFTRTPSAARTAYYQKFGIAILLQEIRSNMTLPASLFGLAIDLAPQDQFSEHVLTNVQQTMFGTYVREGRKS